MRQTRKTFPRHGCPQIDRPGTRTPRRHLRTALRAVLYVGALDIHAHRALQIAGAGAGPHAPAGRRASPAARRLAAPQPARRPSQVSWFGEKGYLQGVRGATLSPDGRLVANADIGEGEDVVALPAHLVLSYRSVDPRMDSASVLGRAIDAHPKLFPLRLIMPLWLCYERHRQNSLWRPYLTSLPSKFDIPSTGRRPSSHSSAAPWPSARAWAGEGSLRRRQRRRRQRRSRRRRRRRRSGRRPGGRSAVADDVQPTTCPLMSCVHYTLRGAWSTRCCFSKR